MLAILGGILLGAGDRIPALWFLSLFGFFPLTMLLARGKSIRSVFGWFLLAGFCAYGLSLNALFWDSLPLTWLGVSGISGVLIIAIVWLFSVVIFMVPFSALLTLAWRLSDASRLALVVVPSAYVLGDWAGAWLFSIVNYGPFGLLGPNFTMGSPAYQLAANGALLQLAWLGSLYALGFAQAFAGVALYRIWVGRRQERIALISIIILALILIGAGSWWFATGHAAETGKPLRVALVGVYEPSILAPTPAQTEEKYATLSRIMAAIPATSTDIIALPEDSRFLLEWHATHDAGPLIPVGNAQAADYIDSSSEREHGTLYSRTEYYRASSDTSAYSYKQFLMPLGEEHPYLYQVVGRLIGQAGVVDTLLSVRGFATKPLSGPVLLHGVPVAALLCSEGMSPTLYAEEARLGASAFFNLASHTWFHESRTMHGIALWNSKVRAVESRRWYARPADDSPSFILDPYGRVTAMSRWGQDGVIYGTIFAREDSTPYDALGQWVLLVPLAMLLLPSAAAALKRLRMRMRKRTMRAE
ncbi:MAG TPA: hypothetical protein VFL98_00690 [Candidatus Paceibacterota bacterium]|nr:hypothetical protein [Candidatus Paceibacterota bacterium]